MSFAVDPEDTSDNASGDKNGEVTRLYHTGCVEMESTGCDTDVVEEQQTVIRVARKAVGSLQPVGADIEQLKGAVMWPQ